MKILTGNDLGSGAVTWWDGQGWSRFVNSAADASADADMILAQTADKVVKMGQQIAVIAPAGA